MKSTNSIGKNQVIDRHPPQQSGILLVTGCPRSGTRSVSLYFKDRGLDIGHEMAGKDGTVDWRHAYNDCSDFKIRMVLVRDPVKTVISLNHLIEGAFKRPCVTQNHIKNLANKGNWIDYLEEGNYFDAALKWWTSVYDYLWGYPTIFVDRSHRISHTNKHITGRADFRPFADTRKFFEVAAMYGYVY